MAADLSPELSDLLDRARAWVAEDPDEETRAELDAAVTAVAGGGDHTDLADAFRGTLESDPSPEKCNK